MGVGVPTVSIASRGGTHGKPGWAPQCGGAGATTAGPGIAGKGALQAFPDTWDRARDTGEEALSLWVSASPFVKLVLD